MRQIGTQGARRCRAPGLWNLTPVAYCTKHLTMVHELNALKPRYLQARGPSAFFAPACFHRARSLEYASASCLGLEKGQDRLIETELITY